MKISAEEDRIIERWATACSETPGRDCNDCPQAKTCQKLADKLIARAQITDSGMRRGC